MTTAKIKAFTLRKKISKAGKEYWISPYGSVDLLGFANETGDIEVSYVERAEVRPVASIYPQASTRASQPSSRQDSPPRITPRPQAVKIIPRDAPHHRPQPIPQDYVDHTKAPYDDGAPMPDLDDMPF